MIIQCHYGSQATHAFLGMLPLYLSDICTEVNDLDFAKSSFFIFVAKLLGHTLSKTFCFYPSLAQNQINCIQL